MGSACPVTRTTFALTLRCELSSCGCGCDGDGAHAVGLLLLCVMHVMCVVSAWSCCAGASDYCVLYASSTCIGIDIILASSS